MTNGGFEIRLNILIHDTMNGHRLFYMYQIINHFCYMLEHDVTCFQIKKKLCIIGTIAWCNMM